MIENVKAINNPLTIIAIFAALAEIAGTVSLGIVKEPNLQVVFIWFVMLFPVLLVVLFFLTLNFNPKVLYAPSDFKSDETFINSLYGVDRLALSFDEIQKQLDNAKTQIMEATVKTIGIVNENERQKLIQIIETKIDAISDKVEVTKESAEDVVLNPSGRQRRTTKAKVLNLLKKENRAMTGAEILRRLTEGGISKEAVIYNLRNLTQNSYLIRSEEGENKHYVYQLSAKGQSVEDSGKS